MPQITQNFSGAKMNKDLDERIVPKGQYRDALNIKISTTDSDSGGLGSVGTVQNIQGNRLVITTSATTGYDGKVSKIIASIADEGNDKAYFFTAAPVPRLGGIEGIAAADIITEVAWIDSIFEVTSVGNNNDVSNGAIFVDRFAVTNTKAGVFTTSSGDIVNGSTYKSNGSFESTPANGYDQLVVLDGTKYRVGMRIYAVDTNNVNLLSDGDNEYVEIVRITGNILTLAQEQTVDLNTAIALKFIHPERVLEFDYYTGDVFNTISLIPTASIDVLDNLLMWTDGKHEPKKINIERSRAGTTNLTTHTKLHVNTPGTDDPDIISDFEYVEFAGLSEDVKREHITVIKKAPTSPPNIEISNKDREQDADCPVQFSFISTELGSPDYNVVPSIGTIKLIEFPDIINFRVDDIYNFVASNVVEPITIRVKIIDIDDTNPNLTTVEILFVDSDLTITANPNNWIVNLETKRPFFETKFGRFGYRYQYEDNEYSTFSPWSELAFLPGNFSYTPSKGLNEGMSNTARKIIVRDWLPTNYTRPLDVKTVDILWKTTDDGNVYIVKSIKRGIDTEWIDMVDNDDLSNTGEFTITSEMIHKVVESNQLLRAWDSVPRYARAQTVTSNRLVYGNYTQGYDLDANIGLLQTVVSKKGLFPTAQKSVKSIRNYQFGIVLGDKYGRETPVISNGYKSAEGQVMPGASKVLKSLSSYSNKFKIKQSWTNSNPTRIPWMEYVKYYVKETSNEYYNLVLDRIYDAGDDNIWLSFNSADRNKVDEGTYLILKNEHGSQSPVDEDARYKIIAISGDAPDYIKTDEREFDLIEMNKVNVYGGDGLGGIADVDDAIPDRLINYKTIRSSNFPTNDDGDLDLEFKGTPKVRIVAQFTTGGITYEAKGPLRTITRYFPSDEVGDAGVAIREVFTASDVSMYQRILTQLPDTTALPVATADTNTDFKYYIQLVDAVVENKPQFDGKFFAKIAKDNTLEARVLGNSLGEYQTLNTYELAFISDDTTNPANDNNEYAGSMDYETANWETIGDFTSSNVAGTTSDLPNFINLNGDSTATDNYWVSWYNNVNRTADIFIDAAPAYSGFNLDTNVEGFGNVDFSTTGFTFNLFDSYSDGNGGTSFNPRGLSNGEFVDTEGQFIFSVIGSDGFSGTNSYFKSKMQTPGTLFKFRDDPNQEVYIVRENKGPGGQGLVGPVTIESKNFDNNGSSIYVDRTSIIVRFARVGLNGQPVLPLTGLDTSVWDPRGTVKHNGLTSMTIDFVQRVAVGSLSEDSIDTSAACFETEPTEDVGLDIYYEASGAIPVRLKLDNIIPFTNANKIKERAGGFGIESRQITNDTSIDVNLTGDPYVYQTIDDDNVFIKRRVNNNFIALKTIITDGVSDGVCPAIGDIVRFEHKSGLVTKSKILDHSKILTTPIAVPSNRYTLTGDGNNAILNDDIPPYITVSIGDSNYGNVEVGMQVTGDNVKPGTFIESIQGASFKLNQKLITEGSSSFTFIDVTGVFKIEKEVWKYSVELGWFNCYSFGNGVESDRIRDDFNAPQIDNGIKVSSTFLNYGEENKTSSMIFSGLYNSTSGVNNLNQFNMAEKITKDINTTYGSIQATIARDNDVVVFAEDKVMRVQSGGKDALFNADGNPQLTATNRVLGTTMPFTGDYGISKNPESLATDNYRMYFTDKQRGAVLRLSNNGITPISDAGMKNYFRENLKYYINITGSVNGVDDEFNLTLHDTSKFNGFGSKTISFSESGKGWVSFKSFTPLATAGLNDKYYSVEDNTIWVHHSDIALRNSFYNTQYNSNITLLFNDAPGSVKSFKNINYEGSQAKVTQSTTSSVTDAAGNTFTANDNEYYNLSAKSGWYVSDITTDKQSGSIHEFIEKEGKWFNYINGDTTTDSNLDTSEFSVQGIGFPLVNPTDTQTESEIIIQAVDADGENL